MFTSSGCTVAEILHDVVDQVLDTLHGVATDRISNTEPVSSRRLSDDEAAELKSLIVRFFGNQELLVIPSVFVDLTPKGKSSTIEVMVSIKKPQPA